MALKNGTRDIFFNEPFMVVHVCAVGNPRFNYILVVVVEL